MVNEVARTAITAARTQSAQGPAFGIGQCLLRCRLAYGVTTVIHDAATSWAMSNTKHTTTNPASIPRGAPIYWTGGSHGYGHIAIAAGDGMCWSTDIRRIGYFDKVPITDITATWPSVKLAGWSEEVNGVRVYGSARTPQTPKEPTTMAARIDGIDLSHYQSGALNFAKAKAAGVRWVFHKSTEGTSYVDPAYAGRRTEVAKAGIPFGAYHFARPHMSDGKTQALYFLAHAKPKPGDMRPMLDLEDQGGLTKAALTKWVGAFVAEVVAATGVPPFIYTSFDLGKTFDAPLWVARYSNAMSAPKIPAPWKSYTVWQFSDGVYGHPNTVPGIGACDINTMNGDPAKLTDVFVLADPTPAKPVKPKPKPVVVPPVARPSYKRLQVNVQQTDPTATAVAHVEECAAVGADVIVWNELGTFELQTAVHNLADFDTYMPQPTDRKRSQNAVAISWRRDRFRMVGDGETEILHGGFAGMTPTRVLHTVLLEDLTGGVHRHYEQATHTVHHVEVGGLPRVRGALTGQNGRAKVSFAKIAASIEGRIAAVFGSGDLNVDYLAEKALPPSQRCKWFPMTVLGAVARIYHPNNHGGTHGTRLIDWGWVTGSLSVADARVLPHGSSDHNPVLWTVEQL